MNFESEMQELNEILQQVATFRTGIDQLLGCHGPLPSPNSTAQGELDAYGDADLVWHALSCGLMSISSAMEHLALFDLGLRAEGLTTAPFTAIRGCLESAAIATWLFEPNIGAWERVGRHFSFRYHGLEEQRKFAALVGSQESLTNIQLREVEVENQAVSLGFPKLEKNGRRTGIGFQWPGTLGLISDAVGSEAEYRMLSGIAHGQHWALSQIAYNITDALGELTAQKSINPRAVILGAKIGISSTSRGIENLWPFFGWPHEEAHKLVVETSKSLRISPRLKFWA